MNAFQLESARETAYAVSMLRREARSLTLMAASLDTAFYGAVKCLAAAKGRIAVTGIGKSIHIGRKVVSLMLSSGLSAYAVSLDAADYGEVGMIQPEDAVLVFSDSGDAFALSVLVRHTSRYRIPVVGVTNHAKSLLGRYSSHLILFPEAEMEMPGGGTSVSATLQMALGEVLVASLVRCACGESEEMHSSDQGKDFRRVNPLTVKDIMHVKEDVPLVTAPTPMPDLLNIMTEKGFGVAGIVVKGRLAGVVSDESLRRRMRSGKKPGESARDVMRPVSVTVEETTPAVTALHLMREKNIYSLFVTRSGSPVGIVSIYDCLSAGME